MDGETQETEVWEAWVAETHETLHNVKDYIGLVSPFSFCLKDQYTMYTTKTCDSAVVPTSATLEGSATEWILVHKNGVSIVGLTKNHPAVIAARALGSNGNNIGCFSVNVTFVPSVTNKTVSGKRRRGATQCQPSMDICTIKLEASAKSQARTAEQCDSPCVSKATSWTVKCPVFGQIVEYNSELEFTLQRVWEYPADSATFLWVMIVVPQTHQQLQKSLALLDLADRSTQCSLFGPAVAGSKVCAS